MARLIGFPVRASGLAIIFIGLAFAMSATQATAFGGGGSRRPAQNAVPSCPSGQYYSSRCRQCAKRCRSGYVWACGRGCVQKSSLNLNDGELYAEAVSLIGAEYYAHALELLWAIEARQDPKVSNYIGLTVRKLGQVDEGIKYYHEALALDPDYTLAREYLGEGYLQKGIWRQPRRSSPKSKSVAAPTSAANTRSWPKPSPISLPESRSAKRPGRRT